MKNFNKFQEIQEKINLIEVEIVKYENSITKKSKYEKMNAQYYKLVAKQSELKFNETDIEAYESYYMTEYEY